MLDRRVKFRSIIRGVASAPSADCRARSTEYDRLSRHYLFHVALGLFNVYAWFL